MSPYIHVLFMYDGRDKNTNSQTNSSTKHIFNTYVMQYKIYCKYIMIDIYFRVCVRIFNRWKERERDNYNYWPHSYINSN